MTEQEYTQILEKLAKYEQIKRQISLSTEALERLEIGVKFAISFDQYPANDTFSIPADRMPDLDAILIQYFKQQIEEYEHCMNTFSLDDSMDDSIEKGWAKIEQIREEIAACHNNKQDQ